MADARENLQRRESRSMEETQGRTVYGRLERRCEGDLRSRENEDSVSRTSEAGQIRHHRRENLQRNLPTNQNDRGRRSEMAQSSAYPVRPRKGDCWNYVKTGQCRYGSNCIYNHTPQGPMRQDFIVPGYVHSQGITNPDSRYPALRERFRENQREDIERQMRELIMQDNQFDSRDRDSDWSFEHTQFEKEPENTQPQGYMPPPSMPMMSQLPRPTQMPPQGHMPPPSMPMMSQLPRPMQMPPQGHMPPPSMPMMSHQMPGSVGMQGAMYPPVLPSYFMNPQGLPSGGGPQMCYPQGLGGFNSPQMVPPGFNNPYQQQPQPPLPPGPPPPNNNNQSHQ